MKEETGDKPTVTPKFTFPMTDWVEWNQDCEENFNDCRAVKAMSDHNFRKQFMKEVLLTYHELFSRIDVLEEQVFAVKEEPKKEKEGIPRLGSD